MLRDRERRVQRDAIVEVDDVATVMRMQPWEAAVPMEASSAVPWMPAPSQKPIQRALIGLSGSFPVITLPARSPAQALSGTYQAGFAALLSIS